MCHVGGVPVDLRVGGGPTKLAADRDRFGGLDG
jgi:hypothetical protein